MSEDGELTVTAVDQTERPLIGETATGTTPPYQVEIGRTADGEFKLRADGNVVGTGTDEFLPRVDRFRLQNRSDGTSDWTGWRCGEDTGVGDPHST